MKSLPSPLPMPESPILDALEALYAAREDEIERWLAGKRAEAPPLLTTSVDLRHSGARLAPVDTNLYPAGFHNLSARAEARAARFLRRYLDESYPRAERLLIVPESHTRNLPYLDNLLALARIAEQAGLKARIGSLTATEPVALTAASGAEVVQFPFAAGGEFTPDLMLLNNDCTPGVPPQLENLAQPILPPPALGWWRRRKSVHFAAYRALAEDFSRAFGLDPWLINAEFHACGAIDFKHKSGLDALARAVDAVLARARAKHAEYGVADAPYVFIKADSGTYGMGIMTARDGAEVLDINKKERNKMHVVKEGAQVSEVIIQEGIPTADVVQGKPAEPMVYLIDGVPVGGMYRMNGARDAYGNLNATGMEFTGMCDESETIFDCRQPVKDCRFRSFGLIAALAALAAGRESYP